MPETRRRAKIVCTIGPASRSETVLRRLIRAGMDVARLNFSHGTQADHAASASALRRLAAEEGRTVALLQDLQGPKLRVGAIPGPPLMLRRGRPFTLTTRAGIAEPEELSVSYRNLPRDVRPGDTILIDDGLIRLEVERIDGREVFCRIRAGGAVTSHKGVNIPGRKLSTPSLTAKDRADLAFGLELGVDFVALSFVREARDVHALRRLLRRLDADTPVIAKLEKPQAVENLDAILAAADGIMVARGDLGVELPPEDVPVLQKRMIGDARAAGKPVITATQMLESMVDHPRPTRAEASDVANAIFDGTDAVMLSAETASGAYPVESVRMMARIIRTAERSLPGRPTRDGPTCRPSIADAVGSAASKAAHELGARVIGVFTQSGSTAQLVSKYRPEMPIYAFTTSPEVLRRLCLLWGVAPRLETPLPTTDAMIESLIARLRAERKVKAGDHVVITAGTPVGRPGSTNFLKIHRVES